MIGGDTVPIDLSTVDIIIRIWESKNGYLHRRLISHKMGTTRPRSGQWIQRRKAALDAIPPIEQSVEGGILHVTRQFRGLELEQAMRYLEHLGGDRISDTEIEADGWRAHLSTRKVPVGPSYRLTEVTVTWTGREEILEPIILHFRLKAFRAPG
jgi:hypothetical protein